MSQRVSRRQFLLHGVAGLATAGTAYQRALAAPTTAAPHEYWRHGMRYRRLGRTDLYVSCLAFGSHTAAAFKRPAQYGHVLNEEGQTRRDRRIAKALDYGVNLVDTYENEGQHEPMARLVRPQRSRVLVSLTRQQPAFVGQNIDDGARLFGYVDLYRIYTGDGPAVDRRILEDWDVMRKAKQAGKVRAIGISTHSPPMMVSAVRELEGLDYIMFPYNFIHAGADYGQFLPAAVEQGVGLIAIKPLAAGSIMALDPRARAGSQPENARIQLYRQRNQPLLAGVVEKLTRSLDRLPDETLCQAALRFVYARSFIASAMPGMFQEHELDDNVAALQRHRRLTQDEQAALDAARQWSAIRGSQWLPSAYRWLDQRWRV